MKIGIDLDDVIADFFETLLEHHNKKYGRSDRAEDFKEWKWWPVWGITREETIKRVDEFHEIHKIEEVPPIKGALDAINKLSKDNELFVITSRPSRFKNKIESWIKHHLKREIRVIHAGDFHKDGRATKAEICQELGVELMVEDGGEIAINCADNGINVLLFDKPWNQNVGHKNIVRVRGWKEILEKIEEMKK